MELIIKMVEAISNTQAPENAPAIFSEILYYTPSIIDKYHDVINGDMKQSAFIDWIQEEWRIVSAHVKLSHRQFSFDVIDDDFMKTRGPNFVEIKPSISEGGAIELVSLYQRPEDGRRVKVGIKADNENPNKLKYLRVVDETYLPDEERASLPLEQQSHSKTEDLEIFFYGGSLLTDYRVDQRTKSVFTEEDRQEDDEGWKW